MCVFLGDALGAPHEFICNASTPYTGKLEFATFRTSQFQGKQELIVGQVTDDLELTITLLRTIIKDNGYVKDNVIKAYLTWCNSEGLWMIGKNTRALLKGIKTIKGYQNRMNKILALPDDQISQSNGSLMRVSPLALLKDDICFVDDCNITNPSKVNRDCNLVYIKSLRLALEGHNWNHIFNNARKIAETQELKDVLQQVKDRKYRDMTINKGHVLHSIYCTFIVISSFDNFSKAMEWIIKDNKGCDTDTNAAIAGAMLGAILGFDKIKTEPQTNENIEIMLNADTKNGPTKRDDYYQPFDFYELTEKAFNLTK
jgi:ADP-ribosylglycohydrolase